MSGVEPQCSAMGVEPLNPQGEDETLRYPAVRVEPLSPQVDAEALRRIFEKFGSIASVTTPKGGAGETLPHGVVRFYSLGDAEDAAECLDGSLVGGKTVEVRVDDLGCLPPP